MCVYDISVDGEQKRVGNSLGGEETGKWVLFLKGGNRLRKRGIEMSWDVMTLNWAPPWW